MKKYNLVKFKISKENLRKIEMKDRKIILNQQNHKKNLSEENTKGDGSVSKAANNVRRMKS